MEIIAELLYVGHQSIYSNLGWSVYAILQKVGQTLRRELGAPHGRCADPKHLLVGVCQFWKLLFCASFQPYIVSFVSCPDPLIVSHVFV